MTPEIEGWLRLAEESREAAETLLGAGHARICASRAYYAMFYCASALHLSQGRSFSRHGSVIGAFARYFVKTGLFDRKFHSYLHGAFEERQISDYDALGDVPYDDARAALDRAAEFIEATKAYLREHEGEEGGDDA